jgi:hypothetical protein
MESRRRQAVGSRFERLPPECARFRRRQNLIRRESIGTASTAGHNRSIVPYCAARFLSRPAAALRHAADQVT